MAHPATHTFAKKTNTDFDALTQIIEGQKFVIDGYEYRAESDAATYTNSGFDHVSIDAERLNPPMPIGWELTAVTAHRKTKKAHRPRIIDLKNRAPGPMCVTGQ